ncbi:dynamin family protein [Rhodopirellula sp. UBA1907]|uniref:dynamin family protein n=1 Tax=Rhodopirellula sp. UBA1907 TaxID=1947381 RepID=UPI00257EF079|nr:dynamin family protein [Rhodopirellula sp. UBA1907]
MHVFDFADIQPVVDSFCEKIPRLLAEHSVTADLVSRVVNLGEQASSPFTVAVVGQMRVGKSSLINALLEKDLAQTGVTETTATINWIRHGDDPSVVRVHWKEKPAELIHREALQDWSGDSSKAANTRFIELFDDAAFLKVASIVDTPGLRSVIDSHEHATNEFLGMKCDSESRQLGSQADAIVYVLMPVAREKDDAFLATFCDQTQLPGSSSFNSLAVLHKWETLESDDQVTAGNEKAQRIAKALGESVSCVIPVSAPLARAAQCLDASHWDSLVRLAATPENILTDDLLWSDADFVDEHSECTLSSSEREELLGLGLPWPSLKLIITLAFREKPSDGESLRELVNATGRIGFLRSELDRRFFARSRSLKLLSTVAKAWEPCRLAEIRLRNKRKDVGDLLVSSEGLLAVLQDRIQAGDDDLSDVRRYVSTTQDALRREHKSLTSVLQQISHEASTLKSIYEDFSGDLAGLEWLGSDAAKPLSEPLHNLMGRLFGRSGVSAVDRAPRMAEGDAEMIDAIERNLDLVTDARTRSKGEAKQILGHAAERLEQLANHYENIEQESR